MSQCGGHLPLFFILSVLFGENSFPCSMPFYLRNCLKFFSTQGFEFSFWVALPVSPSCLSIKPCVVH